MDRLPSTPEEFQIWMVQKVGEIHTDVATVKGDVKVAIANHDALKSRVTNIERDARVAKYWENGKMLAMLVLNGASRFVWPHRS